MTLIFDARLFPPSKCLIPARSRANPFPFHNPRWTDDDPRPNLHARGAKKVGLAYERRVLDVLCAIYGRAFRPSPVIRYGVGQQKKAAIPDGVLRLGGEILVIEIKLGHTERVWDQLMERYLPLVRALEPGRRIRPVEICRSYDPAIMLPGPHTKIDSLHRPPNAGLEVLQWKI